MWGCEPASPREVLVNHYPKWMIYDRYGELVRGSWLVGSRPSEPGGSPAAGAAEGPQQESGSRPRGSSESAGAATERELHVVFDPPFSEPDSDADDEHEQPARREHRPWVGAIDGRHYFELYGRGYTSESEHPQPDHHFK